MHALSWNSLVWSLRLTKSHPKPQLPKWRSSVKLRKIKGSSIPLASLLLCLNLVHQVKLQYFTIIYLFNNLFGNYRTFPSKQFLHFFDLNVVYLHASSVFLLSLFSSRINPFQIEPVRHSLIVTLLFWSFLVNIGIHDLVSLIIWYSLCLTTSLDDWSLFYQYYILRTSTYSWKLPATINISLLFQI